MNRRRVVPLYTRVDARPVYRVLRSARTSVRLGLSFPILQHKLHDHGGLQLMGPNLSLGSGPLSFTVKRHLLGLYGLQSS